MVFGRATTAKGIYTTILQKATLKNAHTQWFLKKPRLQKALTQPFYKKPL